MSPPCGTIPKAIATIPTRNPKSEVRWGDQSWEEMLLAWVTLEIDPSTDVNHLFQKPSQ